MDLYSPRPTGMFSMRALTGGVTIQIPNPEQDSAKNLIATLVNAGRNANAVVVAQKLGRDQEKTEMSWKYLTRNEWETLLRFWDKNFYFNFTYYSRIQGQKITRKFYIGDRSDRPYPIGLDMKTGQPLGYLDCVANVIDTGESA